MLYETKFLISLGATSAIEVPIVFVLVKYFFERKNRSKTLKSWKILLVAFLTSVITLPYLWFILPPFVDARTYIITGEILVVIVETLIITLLLDVKIHKAFLISLIANTASYFLGKYI